MERLVNVTGQVGVTLLGQVPQTLGALLDKFIGISVLLQLLDKHWNQFVDIVDDLGFPRDAQDPVEGHKYPKLLLFELGRQLRSEILKYFIRLFLVFLQIFVEVFGGLFLHLLVLLLELSPNVGQLDVLVLVVMSHIWLLFLYLL